MLSSDYHWHVEDTDGNYSHDHTTSKRGAIRSCRKNILVGGEGSKGWVKAKNGDLVFQAHGKVNEKGRVVVIIEEL